MASFSHISGAEPSTITFKAATVVQTRNSSAMHQELISLADPESSLAIAAILGASPASTTFGIVTREIEQVRVRNSSASDLLVRPVFSSTNADNPVRAILSSTSADNPVRPVFSSTSADNPVQISGNSTAFQGGGAWAIKGDSTSFQGTSPWVIAGNSTAIQGTSPWIIGGNSTVAPLAGSTWATRPIQSSAADLQVTATIGTNLQSTAAPSSNSSGLTVRQVVDAILTTASTSAFAASTSLVIQSSGASLRSYVVGYSITSTVQAPTKVSFYSSGTVLWPIVLAALSSAVTGVNLAVSAPGYLFRTAAGEALTLQTGNSTIGGFKTGVSYFRAP